MPNYLNMGKLEFETWLSDLSRPEKCHMIFVNEAETQAHIINSFFSEELKNVGRVAPFKVKNTDRYVIRFEKVKHLSGQKMINYLHYTNEGKL